MRNSHRKRQKSRKSKTKRQGEGPDCWSVFAFLGEDKELNASMKRSSLLFTKSKSLSSHLWLERQSKDLYVQEREKAGFVARSAFKLIELNAKLRFLRKNSLVLDLGAAPGGWTQVAMRQGCRLVSNDLLDLDHRVLVDAGKEATSLLSFVKGDFTLPETQQKIFHAFGSPG